MAARPNQPVTATTPPALEVFAKTAQIARTDTTAFEAFVIPQGAIICGAYVMGQTASDAATTAIVSVGTNPGTTDDCISAFDVKASTGAGYYAVGAFEGTQIGSLQTTAKLMKAKYTETGTASTTGGPWLVKVEYYFPQPGMTF